MAQLQARPRNVALSALNAGFHDHVGNAYPSGSCSIYVSGSSSLPRDMPIEKPGP